MISAVEEPATAPAKLIRACTLGITTAIKYVDNTSKARSYRESPGMSSFGTNVLTMEDDMPEADAASFSFRLDSSCP